MSDSQPQQPQQQPSGGQQQQLLRPDDILKLQCLPEDEKQKYRLIMQNFWTICNQHPQGSQENTNARQKLTEWSQKFITRERQYRAKMKAQQQQGNQNQGQAGQSSAAGQQNPNAVKQEGGQARPENAAGSVGQQPSNQGQNQGRGQVDPAIVKHVQEFPMQGPLTGPSPGTPEYEVKLKEYRNGYLNMLAKQASLNENRKKLMQQLSERQSNGQELPQDLLVLKGKIEKEHANMRAQIDKFRALQKQWKEEREQNPQGQTQPQAQGQNSAQSPPPLQQQQPSQQQSQPQPPQRQPSQPNVPAQPQIKEEPQIKVEGGQQQQPQPQQQPQSQPQFNMQGNQGNQQPPPQQQHNQQMPPSLPQQQPQQPQQQQPRPPPAPHSQTMPPNQMPQFAQQGQPQQNFHQQQQRPQINPMQANAHQQSNSPHPQSATGTGPPVPLSHQAAVSAANRSYTDPQRTNTPMQPGQGGSFGSREREQLNNPKMPIPRHLNVTSPQPVHMGQSRPTMSGPTNGAPGPMGQPVIPRPPPFQLEGDGDRVLSKRKLDELVRQVTGGSEEALTPEVEEVNLAILSCSHCRSCTNTSFPQAVLQLADDFVDNVISNACKLSKLRDSPQLDIRDIQVILERNYNIRIPGYASDEVRTVRKIVPAQGWASKMNAVNAAKVMGGKTDF